MKATIEASPALALESHTIEYKIASNRQERAEAFGLAYRAYRRAGLCPESYHELRITPYQLLPTTDIFVAELHGETICTISLVRDSRLGLPLEVIYHDEVAARRRQGLSLAEVSCLADRRKDPRRYFPVFLEICRWMVQTARFRGVDQLLVAVHPRHSRFYRRYMAFETIGDVRRYPSVCDHLAIALSLDFQRIDRERPPTYDRFFGKPIPHALLAPCPMSREEIVYFSPLVDGDGCLPLLAQHAFERDPPELHCQEDI
jgi:hypothetical protein